MIASTWARVRSRETPSFPDGGGGDALPLGDQPEEEVLRADVVVVEEPGLLLGEDDHPDAPGP